MAWISSHFSWSCRIPRTWCKWELCPRRFLTTFITQPYTFLDSIFGRWFYTEVDTALFRLAAFIKPDIESRYILLAASKEDLLFLMELSTIRISHFAKRCPAHSAAPCAGRVPITYWGKVDRAAPVREPPSKAPNEYVDGWSFQKVLLNNHAIRGCITCDTMNSCGTSQPFVKWLWLKTE